MKKKKYSNRHVRLEARLGYLNFTEEMFPSIFAKTNSRKEREWSSLRDSILYHCGNFLHLAQFSEHGVKSEENLAAQWGLKICPLHRSFNFTYARRPKFILRASYSLKSSRSAHCTFAALQMGRRRQKVMEPHVSDSSEANKEGMHWCRERSKNLQLNRSNWILW